MIVDTHLLSRVGLKLGLLCLALLALFAGVQLGSMIFMYYVQAHYKEDAVVHAIPIILNNSLVLVIGISLTRVYSMAKLCDSKPPPMAGELEASLKPLVGPSRALP